MDLHQIAAYDYELPKELIAKAPVEPRDSCRLLIVDASRGSFEEICFRDLSSFLQSGDQIVVNDTKVLPARLFAKRESGGRVEILLLRNAGGEAWEALLRPARKCPAGTKLLLDGFEVEVLEELSEGRRLLSPLTAERVQRVGEMPLPSYISRHASSQDRSDYQTVYAQKEGAVAAPTAGLHFTDRMIAEVQEKGVEWLTCTLHVGLGTFAPVKVEDIRAHAMHREYYTLSAESAERLRALPKGAKRIFVGTTCCRVLETIWQKRGEIMADSGESSIFIYPGYRFGVVDHLLTNFHLPRSTLLMLVSALGGYELIKEAYQYAIKQKFRFYSYGDAMLLLA